MCTAHDNRVDYFIFFFFLCLRPCTNKFIVYFIILFFSNIFISKSTTIRAADNAYKRRTVDGHGTMRVFERFPTHARQPQSTYHVRTLYIPLGRPNQYAPAIKRPVLITRVWEFDSVQSNVNFFLFSLVFYTGNSFFLSNSSNREN